jgi:hypothetical protein
MTDRTKASAALFGWVAFLAIVLVMATSYRANAHTILEQFGREEAADCPEGWGPSWAYWPNEGTGGFVCTREIEHEHAPEPVAVGEDSVSDPAPPSGGSGSIPSAPLGGGQFSQTLAAGETWTGAICAPGSIFGTMQNLLEAPYLDFDWSYTEATGVFSTTNTSGSEQTMTFDFICIA